MGKLGSCNCGATMSNVDYPLPYRIHIFEDREVRTPLNDNPTFSLWDFRQGKFMGMANSRIRPTDKSHLAAIQF